MMTYVNTLSGGAPSPLGSPLQTPFNAALFHRAGQVSLGGPLCPPPQGSPPPASVACPDVESATPFTFQLTATV